MKRKVCFISDAGKWGPVGGWTFVQRPTLPPLAVSGEKELLQTEGRHYAETAQSALTITFTLTFGGLNSIILIVLSTVNFQLQGWFAPISLRPVLRILATCHGYTLVII